MYVYTSVYVSVYLENKNTDLVLDFLRVYDFLRLVLIKFCSRWGRQIEKG